MLPQSLETDAVRLLDALRRRNLRLATAESCTGGLIAALITAVAGASEVLDRGFVTYCNRAKMEMLGVPEGLIASEGVVSEAVAVAMAQGALDHSNAQVSIAVTGLAGPDGGAPGKPVGLVHLAAAVAGGETLHRAFEFGDIGRGAVRQETVIAALALLEQAVAGTPGD